MRVIVDSPPPVVAPICLVLGALLGIAGTFAPPSLRGLAWGIDGVALVTAGALLVVHYLRRRQDLAARNAVDVRDQALDLIDLTFGQPIFQVLHKITKGL